MSVEVKPSGPIPIGTTVTLVCAAVSGDLPISYSWTGPDGQDVSLADTDGINLVTLSTSGYYGNYTCTASNEFGMATATLEVIRASRYICITKGGNFGFEF